jgi:hypothetical protein
MDDTQLIELAYKAFMNGANLWEDKDMAKRWNPLESDSDALRLAVKLRMHVSFFGDAIGIGTPGGGYNETKWVDDANAVARRAITRAAAEIGKAMP